jgi:C4-dicarboxylate-specific signal transduction histidine kinase
VHEKAQTAGAAYKPAVTITTKMQDSTLVITVEDNGTGVAENIKDKI